MKFFFEITFLFCMFSNSISIAQTNLVPNPSFEDTAYCVTGSGEMPAALGWDSYLDSPDYFNPCTSDPFVSVPNNWGGYQQPATGNAYSALGTYSSYFGQVDGREFMGRNLSSSLTIGTKYYVSFKVCLSISDTIFANCATNNLGASFSTIPYHWVTNPAPITNNPKVFSTTIITDTLGWTMITGSFIADSAYQYIMLGNFFNDVNTDTLIVNGSFSANCFAYYYIDDVCVSTDSLGCNLSVGISETLTDKLSCSIYPNPVSDYIHISNLNDTYDLTIQNALGQILFEEKNITSSNKRVDANQFDTGLLLINIKTSTKKIYYKFIKI